MFIGSELRFDFGSERCIAVPLEQFVNAGASVYFICGVCFAIGFSSLLLSVPREGCDCDICGVCFAIGSSSLLLSVPRDTVIVVYVVFVLPSVSHLSFFRCLGKAVIVVYVAFLLTSVPHLSFFRCPGIL